MDSGENGKFYREQTFKLILERLDEVHTKVDHIESKLNWVYGWAAGVAGVCALVFSWAKSKFFG